MQESIKVHFAQRDHNPEFKPSQSQIVAGCQVNSTVRCYDTTILPPGEKGRSHFVPIYSGYEEFKPGMRQVPHRLHGDEQREMKRRSLPRPVPVEHPEGKRHDLDSSTRRSESTDLPSVGWIVKRHISYQKSNEYNMEGYMNRKQRVDNETQRNSIPVAAPGDKCYKRSEAEPDFYSKGGLIAGSTIALRKSAKPTLKKKDDITLTNKSTNSMTYAEKQKLLDRQYDIDQIRSLNNQSSRLGQVVPSWEERTGQYICRPEDEKD